MSSRIISIAECHRLISAGQQLNIVDVRTPGEFDRVHAAGARLMPLTELDSSRVTAQRRDSSEPIYLICQSGSRASAACKALESAAVENLYVIEGGTTAWVNAGLPIERGASNVISLERQVRIGAGSLVLIGAALAWGVHWGFLAIPVFIGAGLVFSGVTDYCGMALLLGKMPWNRRKPLGTGDQPVTT